MSMNADRIKLEIKRARVPFACYLFLLACGFTAFYIIFKNQTFQRPWDDYFKTRVAIGDAKGIVPGKQEVRIAGVKVGIMSKSELVNGRPVITLSILRKYAPLYRNAKFRLRAVTPLQDMYMAVQRGTPSAGKLDGSTIVPAEQVTTPVDVSRVMQTFDADTRVRLTALLHGMGVGLKDNGAQLRAAFAQIGPFLTTAQRLTSVMAERRVQLRRAMTNFSAIATALGHRDRQLASLVKRGNSTLGELAARDVPLDRTLRELPGMLDELRGSMASLHTAQADLNPALTELRGTARVLEPGLNGLRDFSVRARPAFVALRPAVGKLRPFARDLRPTAAELASAFQRLDGQAPAYDRITQEIKPCEDTVRDFFSWTPSVTKFGDAYGAFPRSDNTVGFDSAGGLSDIGIKKYPNCTDTAGGK
jgi:ABC-type transporter Mla subunit MlaD